MARSDRLGGVGGGRKGMKLLTVDASFLESAYPWKEYHDRAFETTE